MTSSTRSTASTKSKDDKSRERQQAVPFFFVFCVKKLKRSCFTGHKWQLTLCQMPQRTKNVVGKNVVAFCKLFCVGLPLHIVLFCLCIAGFDCTGKTVVVFFVVKVWRIVALPSASNFVAVLQTFATVCAKMCNFTVEDVHRLSVKLLPTCVRPEWRWVQGRFPTGTVRQPLLWRCRRCRLLLPSDKVSL